MKYFTILIILTSLSIISETVNAKEGLIGEQYFGVQFGTIKPGDDIVKEIDDNIRVISAGVNIPLTPKVDLAISLAKARLNGKAFINDLGLFVDSESDSLNIAGGFVWHPNLEDVKYDPFISVSIIYNKTEIDSVETDGFFAIDIEDDDDDVGISLGIGNEFVFDNNLSLNISLTYINIETFDADDDFVIGVGPHMWLFKQVGLGLNLEHAIDSEDFAIGIGCTVGF